MKLNYQFVAVPTILIEMCDVYTFKLFTLLLNKHNYFNSINKLDDEGYFYLSNDDIAKLMHIDNKEICRINEALYQANLLDIKCCGFAKGQRKTNKYKINFNTIEALAQDNNGAYIQKCKRGTKCSYINNVSVADCNPLDNPLVADCNLKSDVLVADCNLKDDISVADCNPTLYNNYINVLDSNNTLKTVDNKTVEDNNNDDIASFYKALQDEEREIIESMNEDNNTTSNEVATIEIRNKNTSNIQDTITSIFQQLDNLNSRLYHNTPNVESYNYILSEWLKVYDKGKEILNDMSDKQYELFISKVENFDKINKGKIKYFNLKSEHNHQSKTGNKMFNTNPENGNNCAPAPDAEETHNQMVEDLLNRF